MKKIISTVLAVATILSLFISIVPMAIAAEHLSWQVKDPYVYTNLTGLTVNKYGSITTSGGIVINNVYDYTASSTHVFNTESRRANYVIKDDKSLWVWGSNFDGLLGDGTGVDKTEPVKIMDNVMKVVVRNRTAYAICIDNSLWSWGAFVTGDGNKSRKEYSPVKIMDGVKKVLVLSPYGEGVSAIIKTDNTLWTKEPTLANNYSDQNNYYKIMDNVVDAGISSVRFSTRTGGTGFYTLHTNGELHINQYYEYHKNKEKDILLDTNVTFVCPARNGATLHYIKNDGSLWGMGYNKYGEIGDGTKIDKENPVRVLDNVVYMVSQRALKNDGTLWVWDESTGCVPMKISENIAFLGASQSDEFVIFNNGQIKTIGQLYKWSMITYGDDTYTKRPERNEALANQFTWSNAAPAIQVIFDGRKLGFDQPPIIENGRTLVPIRAITEAMGATVDWDGAARKAMISLNNSVVTITIGSKIMYKDGVAIPIDVPAKIVGGRTLVPVRAIAEAFDTTVDWNGNTRTVYIAKKEWPVKITEEDFEHFKLTAGDYDSLFASPMRPTYRTAFTIAGMATEAYGTKFDNNAFSVMGINGFNTTEYIGDMALSMFGVNTNKKEDFKVIIGENKVNNTYVIAFQGSETFENFVWTDFLAQTPTNFMGLNGKSYGSTHTGVYDNYKAYFQNQVFPQLKNINFSTARFIITGHSLGGALAELCAFDLVAYGVLPQNIACVTIAAMDVGGKNFVGNAELLGVSDRIVHIMNKSDALPDTGSMAFTSLASKDNQWTFDKSWGITGFAAFGDNHASEKTYVAYLLSQARLGK